MGWCLRVKLVQNWEKFSQLLIATDHKPIVEDSTKGDFWSAKADGTDLLIGCNVIGRLLMELREQIRNSSPSRWEVVAPVQIGNFLLLGSPIEPVQKSAAIERRLTNGHDRTSWHSQ
jgi:hypothetical protein